MQKICVKDESGKGVINFTPCRAIKCLPQAHSRIMLIPEA